MWIVCLHNIILTVLQEFELPHKRGVYFALRRERFFQAAMLD